MKRLLRTSVHGTTALSAVLFIAVVIFWVRGRWIQDAIVWFDDTGKGRAISSMSGNWVFHYDRAHWRRTEQTVWHGEGVHRLADPIEREGLFGGKSRAFADARDHG